MLERLLANQLEPRTTNNFEGVNDFHVMPDLTKNIQSYNGNKQYADM